MWLLSRCFGRRDSNVNGAGHRRRGDRRCSRRFHFERLERREVLDAESFGLIGVTDYFNNSSFDEFDGSGPGQQPYSIAIIGSGADVNHPDFGDDDNEDGVADRIVYRESFLSPFGSEVPDNRSGTGYAGLIADMAPGVNLVILKAYDGNNHEPVVAALQRAFEISDTYNIVAVHLAIYDTGHLYTSPVTDAGEQIEFVEEIHPKIEQLYSADIPVVTQSGNEFDNTLFVSDEGLTYPAASPYVISVGGVWDNDEGSQHVYNEIDHTGPDQVMAETNRHPEMLDLMAPGAFIEAAFPEGPTISDWWGTGFAAAHVAAAVALAQDMSEHFNSERLTPDELEMLFKDTADTIYDGDDETDTGPGGIEPTDEYYKRLDVEAMAYKLFKPSTAPDLVSTSDWGFSSSDNATGDSTPTFTGTAPPNSHVWLYFGSNAVADGTADSNGDYTLTPSTAQATSGSWSVTIRVAADGNVVEANRSQASPALTVTHTESTNLGDEDTFEAKLSDALSVSGLSAGSSTVEIDWRESPVLVSKDGSGTVTIPDPENENVSITDRGVAVTYYAKGGTSEFNIDTGVAGIPGTSTRVANWTMNADATVNFTTNQNLAALNIEDGGIVSITAATPPNYKVLYVSSFDLVSGGKLDLTNNGMVIDFADVTAAQNAESTIRSALIDGRGGTGLGFGTWWGDSTGIMSSTASTRNQTNPNSRSIGYAVNADLPLAVKTIFLGQTVDSSSILLRYTVTADFDLDGSVDADDTTVIGAEYAPGSPKPHWGKGDADYNGAVDNDDITLYGSFWGSSLES